MVDKVTVVIALVMAWSMIVGGLLMLLALEFNIIKHDKVRISQKMREWLEE
jgi:sterol desaturase/sphingolipid hydroxylase (fatty acid hydroxylase superfamily)